MQSRDSQSEIAALELEIVQKEILLETFLKSKEEFQKANVILRELETLRNKMEELKNKRRKMSS
jgi:hypothetical protein